MVAEWVLILTLAGYTQAPKEIEYIPGFESRALCLTAASVWLTDIRAAPQTFNTMVKAACVQRRGE